MAAVIALNWSSAFVSCLPLERELGGGSAFPSPVRFDASSIESYLTAAFESVFFKRSC